MLNMIIFALLVFGLGIAVIKRPPVALAGIFCIFGLKQWAQGTMPFFVQHGAIPNLCMGLLLLLGLAVKLVRGEQVLSPYPRVGWMCVLLFAYAALTLFWAPNPDKSASLMLLELPYFVTIIILAPLLISDLRDVRSVALGTIIFGGALALLILLQVRWFNRMIVLATANWGNEGANPLAVAQMGGYLVLSAMLLQFRNLRLAGWLIRIGLTGLGLLLIVKSGSRGQFLSLLFILCMFVPMRQKVDSPLKLFTFLVSFSIVAGLAMWLQSGFTTEATIHNRWTSERMFMDVFGRFHNLGILLGIWASGSPGGLLFGLGNSASFSFPQLGIYPHFVPGEILAEEGLLGMALYLGILSQCIGNLRSTYQLVRDNAEARSALALFGAFLVYEFLITLKQGSLIGNAMFFGMAILIGRIRLIAEFEELPQPPEEDLASLDLQDQMADDYAEGPECASEAQSLARSRCS